MVKMESRVPTVPEPYSAYIYIWHRIMHTFHKSQQHLVALPFFL